ncbi:hypothetical protein Pth03_78660 [Planotetraspora thailandica]|uniref:Hemophore-related protein n=1 Tax=Planotetraspora thailandica TaxID=487172 RepID=A0A8J4DG97_9ACTN|nr:hypothetical protein [Planotetraspora thailandica]GII59477.1 hypothetical protein Pth03_78660 [Planotetraspora thailandica]
MRRRTIVTVAAAALVASAAGGVYATTRTTARTPCEAAHALVAHVQTSIRDDAKTIVFRAPDDSLPIWLGMTAMAEDLTSGRAENVEGEPSPDLLQALYEFSRTAPATTRDLTDPTGDVQKALAHITAACS